MNNKNWATYRLIILYLIICGFTAVHAQRVNTWSDYVEDDHFKEGIYSLPVGSKTLELISFYRFFLPFEQNDQQDLIFEVNTPSADSFLLTVQEKSILKYYLLQSKPATLTQGVNRFRPWKEINYLANLNISSNNLGAILESYSGEGKRILPLIISNSIIDSVSNNYHAIFRLTKSISGGIFQVYKGEYDGEPPQDRLLLEKEIKRHMAGATFRIQIEVSALGDYEGWLTVQLNLSKRNSREKIPFPFHFYHSKNN